MLRAELYLYSYILSQNVTVTIFMGSNLNKKHNNFTKTRVLVLDVISLHSHTNKIL